MARHGADADDGFDEKLGVERLLNRLCDLDELFALGVRLDLLDDRNVRLIDGQYEVLLSVGEHACHHVHGRNVGSSDLPDEEHRARHVCYEMQLLGTDVHIAGQNVVGDDIFDKGSLVMLLFIIGLRAVERHVGHDAQASCDFVVALGEYGIVEIRAPADQRLEGLLVDHDNGIRRAVEPDDRLRPFFADQGRITTGNDVAVGVDHADHTVGSFLHLYDDTLKNATGHGEPLLIDYLLHKQPLT